MGSNYTPKPRPDELVKATVYGCDVFGRLMDVEALFYALGKPLALRERVAVEAVPMGAPTRREHERMCAEIDAVLQEPEPPLTQERAREVMREYVARGEWQVDYDDRGRAKYCGESFVDGSTAEVVIADGYDVRVWPLTDGQQMTTITTESALRAFCEGRKA